MRTLVKTANMPREEWLKWRTLGIGGSDASVIVGLNKFRSVYQLWLEKTGQVVPEEEENDYTHFGNLLEPIVRAEFTRRTGIKVRAKKALLQSEEFPYMIADLDGVIYENGEMCIFEAKTASAYKKETWEEGVPVEYELQVQHYMAVTGAKKTYIAALVGGNQFFYYEVYRDEELINIIIQAEQRFWVENVLQRKEPVPDGSDATTDYLKQKYRSSNGETIALPADALELCASYDNLSEQIISVTERRNAVANQLKAYLKENEVGIVGDRKVSWKSVISTSFDKKRLEQENREVYEAYVTKTEYRRFMVA